MIAIHRNGTFEFRKFWEEYGVDLMASLALALALATAFGFLVFSLFRDYMDLALFLTLCMGVLGAAVPWLIRQAMAPEHVENVVRRHVAPPRQMRGADGRFYLDVPADCEFEWMGPDVLIVIPPEGDPQLWSVGADGFTRYDSLKQAPPNVPAGVVPFPGSEGQAGAGGVVE